MSRRRARFFSRSPGWLTGRDEPVTFSARHDASLVAELVEQFCKSQGYADPPDGWHKNIKPYPPTARTHDDIHPKHRAAGTPTWPRKTDEELRNEPAADEWGSNSRAIGDGEDPTGEANPFDEPIEQLPVANNIEENASGEPVNDAESMPTAFACTSSPRSSRVDPPATGYETQWPRGLLGRRGDRQALRFVHRSLRRPCTNPHAVDVGDRDRSIHVRTQLR
jgi:hypothetical protein